MNSHSVSVRNQFPTFYHEFGPDFVEFMRQYFLWLDQEGETSYIQSNLKTIRDVDLTPEEFLEHFKAKYLANIPTNSSVNVRNLLRNVSDLYNSKGSKRSFKLLFKLLFDDSITVSYPGEQVLRASDGTWMVPVYIETTPSDVAKSFINKQVVGSISGARAFVEDFARRFVGGRYINVLLLSGVTGRFVRNDLIGVLGGSLDNAPKVLGSLNDLIITNGGAGFVVGQELDAITGSGKSAKVRVTSIAEATGRVDFDLIEGGTGYTLSANALLSQYVLGVANKTNANSQITGFYTFETVEQRLANVSFLSSTNTFSVGETVTGKTSGGATQGTGTVIEKVQTGANGYLVMQINSGDFRFADDLFGASANAIVDVATDISATANIIGSNGTTIGILSQSNDFRATEDGYTWIRGRTSNTIANVISRSTGSGAGFDVGSITSAESVLLYTDMLNDFNSANVQYQNIFLDGRGSGVGFVDHVAVGTQLNLGTVYGDGFTNTEYIEQIEPVTAGFTGTVAVGANNFRNRVTGTSTNFDQQFVSGDWLYVANATTGFGVCSILSVVNATFMTVDKELSITPISSLTYGKGVVRARGQNYSANSTVVRTYPIDGTFTNTADYLIVSTSSTTNTRTVANVSAVSTLGGTGYANGASVTFTGGGQSVNAITINAGGTGYSNGASVTFTPPARAQLDLFANGETFTINEVVFQSNGTANTGMGILYQNAPGYLIVDVSNGAFIAGANVTGNTSGATSNVSSANTASYGSNASAIAITNSTGGLTGFTFANVGSQYVTAPTVTVPGGTGANLTAVMSVPTPANGTLTTNSTGGITSVTLSDQGAGYFGQAALAVGGAGSGANLFAAMDYGYGFPKSPNADDGSIMDDTLYSNTFNIGTIASLGNIQLGSNYNTDPYLVVIEPKIAGFSRHDFIVNISSPVGTFIVGESVTQNITNPLEYIAFTGISGNSSFQLGEQVYQGNTSNPTARGIVAYVDGSNLRLSDEIGSFVVTSNATTRLFGSTSLAIANATSVTPNTAISVSRGIVKSSNSTSLQIQRRSFNTNFIIGGTITGVSSGATAVPTQVIEDPSSPIMGLNANVDATVVSASGVVGSVEVIDSGVGYVNDEELEFLGTESEFTISGFANTYSYGFGEGRYTSFKSQLNRSYLQDNDYYQDFSYEIGSKQSIDRYFDLVSQLLHVAGTKMFGVVNVTQAANCQVAVETSSVTIA